MDEIGKWVMCLNVVGRTRNEGEEKTKENKKKTSKGVSVR
jgi:hypothetical protein